MVFKKSGKRLTILVWLWWGQVLKYSQSDWNKLRQELELNFQAQLLAKEREWSSKLADRDARLATLEDNNKKLRQINEDMRLE